MSRTESPDATSTDAGAPSGEACDRTGHLRGAVAAAQRLHGTWIEMPVVGRRHVPSGDELAFLAGIGALAVVGALEWPVALVLGTGRVLSHVHRWRSLAAFGEALEHA